ncbi:hypothetical protein Pmar_PMAR022606 [Perkinsus marinus ATCC 50983]|uniref:Uncharacterized protein n=1 Tax=Perkinsus marinus (strain ATCC 50983 / TXsc) TaxID=423536 RepID=C5KFK7_PERM5|nr:hypothetical protein Pmar_PMAR022606 [Perkinsus marinus ATCC 50983]EER16756.1 hypothetical protein Pmar_PMAR022606 [Perkinsus marinus ATCC 50983]|eukprot:XP_002784960.1 hypothetical protein Pmar_PMAR022606 [Perkinsus marinus ATCC 50983]
MNNTPGARQDCEVDSQTTKTSNATRTPNIILMLVTVMTLVLADAFMVDDITGKTIHIPEPRSLRMQVVKEVPDNCLSHNDGWTYCAFILEDSNQVNGGTRLVSSKGDWKTLDLELGVLLASDSSPADVGIYVSGVNIWKFDIFCGISVEVQLSVPTISKNGGYDAASWKVIDFPVSLQTWVTVPHFGTVQAEKQGQGHAHVNLNTSMNSRHELSVDIQADHTSTPLNSSIEVIVKNIYVPEDEAWHYIAYASLGFNLLTDDLQISYHKDTLLSHIRIPFKFPRRSG